MAAQNHPDLRFTAGQYWDTLSADRRVGARSPGLLVTQVMCHPAPVQAEPGSAQCDQPAKAAAVGGAEAVGGYPTPPVRCRGRSGRL